MHFEPLPSSALEVEEVSASWVRHEGVAAGVEIALGSTASESRFKSVASGHRILHLATHGFFIGGDCSSATYHTVNPGFDGLPDRVVGENPLLLSGLVFAGANHRNDCAPGEEDGILTAEEISALDLNGVDWAVLSACNTGVGEVKAGEGVFGLRRAFQIAGARSVIMSLWPVEDEASREWMKRLYENRFVDGMTTMDSVHNASLSLLRERREAGLSTHPFFWAGFIAAGDWR